MIRMSSRFAVLVAGVVVSSPLASAESESSFPFGSELVLDQAPMHGSKRIPMIEIEEDGATSIDLWCASAKAQAAVGDSSITIVPGDLQASAQCEPDRQARDATLLAELAQVTNWRRSGEVVELLGATPLRFRLMTN
ncbi:MAG: META domain-containing protein [Xanthobacteraceae bacterium]